jgi:hypothetical protein
MALKRFRFSNELRDVAVHEAIFLDGRAGCRTVNGSQLECFM